MDQVKVYYDPEGNTLTVWFGDPKQEHVCEETADEFVLIKNRKGQIIGFEKLNFKVPAPKKLKFAFETVST